MSKTIKFNLICDGNSVRTIEDLQNNFSIEDVLCYYHNKLLHRWLEVRGYEEELAKVYNINSEDDIEIITKLISIFDVDKDEKKVEENIYILKFLQMHEKERDFFASKGYNTEQILNRYKEGYHNCKNIILKYPNNVALIKATISEIVSNYEFAFELDHRDLFYALVKSSGFLAIMCLLMNDYTRRYYLPSENEIITEEQNLSFTTKSILHINERESIYNNEYYTDKGKMYRSICRMIAHDDFKANLDKNILSFSGNTNRYWKDLHSKEKKYMIISMGVPDRIRSIGHVGEEYTYSDIKNKFVILDGIDYKSEGNNCQLLYMEV